MWIHVWCVSQQHTIQGLDFHTHYTECSVLLNGRAVNGQCSFECYSGLKHCSLWQVIPCLSRGIKRLSLTRLHTKKSRNSKFSLFLSTLQKWSSLQSPHPPLLLFSRPPEWPRPPRPWVRASLTVRRNRWETNTLSKENTQKGNRKERYLIIWERYLKDHSSTVLLCRKHIS